MDDHLETLAAARKRYFDENGFGADGGYGDAWADFEVGPIAFPFPNTAGRIRALRYHDLHHILTGYPTTTTGEFEISAWEIGAGCKGYAAAWVLNLGAMAAGSVVAPRRTARAFYRGRRDRTLYDEPFEPLLDETVASARTRFLGRRPQNVAADAALLPAFVMAGVFVGLTTFAVLLSLTPLGLVNRARRRAELRASASSST